MIQDKEFINKIEELTNSALSKLPPEQRAKFNSHLNDMMGIAKNGNLNQEQRDELLKLSDKKFRVENGI